MAFDLTFPNKLSVAAGIVTDKFLHVVVRIDVRREGVFGRQTFVAQRTAEGKNLLVNPLHLKGKNFS